MKQVLVFTTTILIILSSMLSPLNANTSIDDEKRRKIIRSNWPAEYMGIINESAISGTLGNNISNVPDIKTILISNFFNSSDPNNWYDTSVMNEQSAQVGDGCIKTDNNGAIQVNLNYIVRSVYYNMQERPAIYYRYKLGTDEGILAETDMQQSTVPGTYNGFPGSGQKKISLTIPIDLSNMADGFNYKFEILALDASNNYIPYPVADYPHLFVEDENTELGLDFTVDLGSKYLCPGNIGYVRTFNPIVAEYKEERPRNIQTLSSWNAYPNPCSDQLTITVNCEEAFTIQLVDVSGKQVFYKKNDIFVNNVSQIIDVSFLKSGIYYCFLASKTNKQYIKIVKTTVTTSN